MTRKRLGSADLADLPHWVFLADRVKGPPVITEVPIPHPTHDVTITLEFDGTRYAVTDLKMAQRKGGPPVGGAAVRALTLASSLAQATAEAVVPFLVFTNEEGTSGKPASFNLPTGVKGNGPTPEALEWVARIYRVALAVGWEPRQQVARTFGLPADTASDWIRRTRKAGLLGTTTPGKAGS